MPHKAVIAPRFGLDHLAVAERPTPEPGHGEVRVRVRAVSLNRRDALLVQGVYNPRQRLPVVPCSDASGTVEAVGAGVARLKPGDRVVAHFFTGWIAGEPTSEKLATALGGAGGDGTLQEAVVLPEQALLPIPDSMSFEAASTLPCAALTAWSALRDARPGDTVLVQGTGGVSIFALQFARLAGARVIATTSSEDKAERLRALGAAAVLNYRTDPDWGRHAREAAGGRLDLVVDVGGATTLDTSLRAVRPGGTIALVGVLGGAAATITLPLAVMRQVRLQGITCGDREAFEAMLRGIDRHGVEPVISHTFAFDESPLAFRAMEEGSHFGKIVIRL
ncbi:MAG TPA: NAD(P)-dependent alcohol dehydrogenase [Microvirga sp.]|jgi:NADPH:quinone reductase-like Zn-dependent oxidoreductase|nr:NAD(P)-dependent alcohol dehydrogenase [Microvirga sp.]